MKSLVVSKPVADFLALLRVLMTSPEGKTTVFRPINGDANECRIDDSQRLETTRPLLSHI